MRRLLNMCSICTVHTPWQTFLWVPSPPVLFPASWPPTSQPVNEISSLIIICLELHCNSILCTCMTVWGTFSLWVAFISRSLSSSLSFSFLLYSSRFSYQRRECNTVYAVITTSTFFISKMLLEQLLFFFLQQHIKLLEVAVSDSCCW